MDQEKRGKAIELLNDKNAVLQDILRRTSEFYDKYSGGEENPGIRFADAYYFLYKSREPKFEKAAALQKDINALGGEWKDDGEIAGLAAENDGFVGKIRELDLKNIELGEHKSARLKNDFRRFNESRHPDGDYVLRFRSVFLSESNR